MIHRTTTLLFKDEYDQEGEIVEVAFLLSDVSVWYEHEGLCQVVLKNGEYIDIPESFEEFYKIMEEFFNPKTVRLFTN